MNVHIFKANKNWISHKNINQIIKMGNKDTLNSLQIILKKAVLLASVILLIIVIPKSAISQEKEGEKEEEPKPKSIKERIFFGGSLGMQFGSITVINVSPMVGFKITNKMDIGLTGTYQYYNNKYFSGSSDIYGGSLFARHTIYKQIFAHIEYEALSLGSARFSQTNLETNRFWEQNYFAGGGVRLHLGGKTYLNLMLLYNFNTDSKVYYQNPLFRFGIDIGM